MPREWPQLPAWFRTQLIELAERALKEARERLKDGDDEMPDGNELSRFVNRWFELADQSNVDLDDPGMREVVNTVHGFGADHFDPNEQPHHVLGECAETVVWNQWNDWLQDRPLQLSLNVELTRANSFSNRSKVQSDNVSSS